MPLQKSACVKLLKGLSDLSLLSVCKVVTSMHITDTYQAVPAPCKPFSACNTQACAMLLGRSLNRFVTTLTISSFHI